MRLRLLTNLVFNLVVAIWVWHDARRRRARKPVFAAALALLWGPLGVAFWASERPLTSGERRIGGTAAVMARYFALAWTAMIPAVFVLVVPLMAYRAAVPGSLGATLGVRTAALIVTLAVWLIPAVFALCLGGLLRERRRELGTSSTPPGSLPPVVAVTLAGAAAFLFVWWQTP